MLETDFDTTFIAVLASREKQIQQTYRPVIGVHKWFARRPGTLFRGLLLSEFAKGRVADEFMRGHNFAGLVIADPFMGGGTPLIEANRLGMSVIGRDINPMAYWVVRQSLAPLDLKLFAETAAQIARDVETEVGARYETACTECGAVAQVKYFLWVKQSDCRVCAAANDLFPGYLVAKPDRHTSYVWYCAHCEKLAEIPDAPTEAFPASCPHCQQPLAVSGTASRNSFTCKTCAAPNRYPDPESVPRHRLFAIEYRCHSCHGSRRGRYFKVPDQDDLIRYEAASRALHSSVDSLPEGLRSSPSADAPGEDSRIPTDEIPDGDETERLHRWGYRRYRDLFNDRQLAGLQTLLGRIMEVSDYEVKAALATVFSDFLRYQNMLCRYDTYALKCQDIFSVHGFPVGLIQCENNLLGIPGVGGGGFRHFVEKYGRAKRYCRRPFEVAFHGQRKQTVNTPGEKIEATFTTDVAAIGPRSAALAAGDASLLSLPPNSLDGVFTDPPYYDNVQYAELMDFCYVWLRKVLGASEPSFAPASTRNTGELTGNATLSRGLSEFTTGLSQVFCRMAAALKPGAPLAFTYHHNRQEAYVPLVVAILDAGLECTATLACPAEMSASLHINGTGSSILDTIFVCRKPPSPAPEPAPFPACLMKEIRELAAAGIVVTDGDVACLTLGHHSRAAIRTLGRSSWNPCLDTARRLSLAAVELERQVVMAGPPALVAPDRESVVAPIGPRAVGAQTSAGTSMEWNLFTLA
ncbi:MAG: DNA methylase [Capsulimonadaceae bacterium]